MLDSTYADYFVKLGRHMSFASVLRACFLVLRAYSCSQHLRTFPSDVHNFPGSVSSTARDVVYSRAAAVRRHGRRTSGEYVAMLELGIIFGYVGSAY
jgi:hypothetical protein